VKLELCSPTERYRPQAPLCGDHQKHHPSHTGLALDPKINLLVNHSYGNDHIIGVLILLNWTSWCYHLFWRIWSFESFAPSRSQHLQVQFLLRDTALFQETQDLLDLWERWYLHLRHGLELGQDAALRCLAPKPNKNVTSFQSGTARDLRFMSGRNDGFMWLNVI